MRGRTQPRIDDERKPWKISPQTFEAGFVDDATPGANGRRPRHDDLTASAHQPFGHRQIFRGVGKDLEAIFGQRFGGLDQAEDVGLQRVVVADHFEFDPIGTE